MRMKIGCVGICILFAACQSPTQTETSDNIEGRGSKAQAWYDNLPRAEWAEYEQVLEDTEWFEIYKIRPGTFAIYEPGQFEETISFLILGAERALLFDTGIGVGDIKAVVTQLTDLPVTVVNSHAHYDHIGGNHQFKDILCLNTDYGRKRQKGLPKNEAAEFIQPAWLGYKDLPANFNRNTYSIKPYKISGPVTDGDVIDLGGRSLKVIHLPGHSPDSIALLDNEAQDLYVGDIFYLAPLYAHLEGSDMSAYQASANRLAALAPVLDDVMTAHNVPIVSPEYLIKMRSGFNAIQSGDAEFIITDGAREYDFGDFSIITSDPPDK